MRLENSTKYPDRFLRRMVAWCCREIGHKVKRIKLARFRNRDMIGGFSGNGGSGKITIRIGRNSYPIPEYKRYGSLHCSFADELEVLVGVTAHEIYHCWQTFHKKMRDGRHNEGSAQMAERYAVKAFAANRDALLAKWRAGLVETPPALAAESAPNFKTLLRASIRERRAAKAAAMLARWQRKLKLAKTKCRHYEKRCKYYARKAGQ